ncbi:MAG: hypothetical protein ACYCT6_10370 [bacterium]
MRNKLLLIIFLLLFVPVKAYSFALTGSTYPIAEPNLLAQINNRAKKIEDHPKILKRKMKKILYDYTPSYYKKLRPAANSYTFYHDVVYKLPFPIPRVEDGKIVGVLYPKGFTFHVLKYLPFDFPTLVIFSMKNKYERFYVSRKYGYDKNPEAMLLTANGDLRSIIKMTKSIKKMVYTNINTLDRRFGVKNTISIVKRSIEHTDDVKVKVIGIKYLRQYYLKHKK